MQTTRLLSEESLDRGYQLGDYTLLERIGRGGEGVVWSAWNNRLRRVVAIKFVAVLGDDPALVSQATSDFQRQVHLLASLDHPHILPLYEFGVTEDYYFFVMRYNSVGSLAHRLLAGPLPLADALHITAQIASALYYLHRRSIVHRDLKPSNILLDSQNRVYLSDFGLAKQLAQATIPFHTGRGSGPYAPYEQYHFLNVTAQSDIYSLGVVIFEMLTGKLPWGDSTGSSTRPLQGQSRELPDLHTMNPALPALLTEGLQQLTAFNWKDRPATVTDAYQLIVQSVPDNGRMADLSQATPIPEDALIREDADYLVSLFLSDWRPGREEFPARLTHLAYIDAASTQTGHHQLPLTDQLRRFMLRGALTYGHHLDYWWRQVPEPEWRWRVFEETLANESETAVDRALAQMSNESDDSLSLDKISPATLDLLIDLSVSAKGWRLRNNAFHILEKGVAKPTQWQPVAFTEQGDAKLAELVLRDTSQSEQATRLIGQMRSQTAVQILLDAQDRMDESRFFNTLQTIQTAAGGLPPQVPLPLRLKLLLRLAREQLLEDREGLSLSRALIGSLAGVFVALLMLFGFFSRADAQLRDILIAPYPVSGIVTIVEVNDESLNIYGRWAGWPRSLHADLINELNAAGAKAIAFDVVFDSESEEDDILIAAMQQAGNVVQPVLGQGDAYHDVPGAMRFEERILPLAGLQSASAALGHTNILHDEDGYVRRLPTIIAVGEERHSSLALAALQVYLGVGGNTWPQVEDGFLTVAGRQIPVSELGEMPIYYAGPPAQPGATTFPIVPYHDVLAGRVSPDLFKDKIVLVGITATAEPDNYLTPVSNGRPMYGVEILANVIESVWSNRFIVQAGHGIRFALLVVLGAITGLVCARPWLGLVLSVVVAGLYFSVASVVFDLQGVMLDLLFPFMSIALSYAAVTAYRFSIETRRRREIMRLFAANVTPEVARSAITAVKSGQITLSGQAQEVSVLLADMRGYSAYAETHDPQEVMDTIRSFRDMMVQAVFEFEGTIAQYEGEQLMALFNAPLPQSDHPWRAVEAAMAMKARIETYHQSLPADHPHRFISAGYGIYTGRAIVGNTGGDGRYAYTAIGDTVDLAVHLAGSAKVTQILLGEATYERVETLLVVETLPTTLVRGNTTPITVFAAVAPR